MQTFIAIGSSDADAMRQVERAVKRIGEASEVNVVAVSSWFETASVGSAGTRFINGVIEVSTTLSPLELLEGLQAIERDLGRVPGQRWGPRAIDLDLLAFGEVELHDGRLILPHPALWYRRFVLDPWEQIAGYWIVPRWHMSVADLRQRLLQRPLPVRLAGGDEVSRQAIADEMNDRFGELVTITSASDPESASTGPSESSGPTYLSLGYIPHMTQGDEFSRWSLNLTQLAADLQTNESTAAGFVLTAAMDEPQEIRD